MLREKPGKNRQRQQRSTAKKRFYNLFVRLLRRDFYANDFVLAAAIFFGGNSTFCFIITAVIATSIRRPLK